MNRIIKYQEVYVKRTRKWIDEYGKKRQETRTFLQTINPFNKNEKGEVKTYKEIWGEINKSADEWVKGMDKRNG